MYEPESDSEVLSFFDVDRFFSYYYGESSERGIICPQPYTYDDTVYSNTNNDGISHTLQEQLSGLSITGASEPLHTEESSQSSTNVQPWPHIEYPQSSFGVQPWDSPPRNYYAGNKGVLEAIDSVGPSSSSPSSGDKYFTKFSGNNGVLEEIDSVGPSSSNSSSGDRYYDGEEQNQALENTDESEIDGGIDTKLNEMNAVRHTPRTNGDIPPVDDAMSDHERLLNRLQLSGLVENKVEGDGNCQFRALSDQLYQTPEHHRYVRKQVVKQLKDHPEMYEEYVPMVYGDYLKKMMRNGEWGDHVTLQAAADLYGVKILIVTSFKDTWYIEIIPKTEKLERVVYLSFWAEVHYNSIYLQGVAEYDEKVKRKKWWNVGNKNQGS